MDGPDRALSRRSSIAVGLTVAAAGLAIVAVSVFARADAMQAPRSIVACAGGAFVFFGGWTAGIYAAGFDPNRPLDGLPSAWVQLAVFVPGMLMFAAPFHWVAFGPGPRQFSGSLSIPFLTVASRGGASTGRAFFGAGALLVDVVIVASVAAIWKRRRRPDVAGQAGAS